MELGGALFSDGWRNDREERLRLGRPDGAAIDKNCGHPCGIEPHRVAAIGRELIVWEEFPNSREHEPPVFYPSETHSSKTDADPAVVLSDPFVISAVMQSVGHLHGGDPTGKTSGPPGAEAA